MGTTNVSSENCFASAGTYDVGICLVQRYIGKVIDSLYFSSSFMITFSSFLFKRGETNERKDAVLTPRVRDKKEHTNVILPVMPNTPQVL